MDVVRVISQAVHSILAGDPQWRWDSSDGPEEDHGTSTTVHTYVHMLYSNTIPIVEITKFNKGCDIELPMSTLVRVRTLPTWGSRRYQYIDRTLYLVRSMIRGLGIQGDAIASEVERWLCDDTNKWLQP